MTGAYKRPGWVGCNRIDLRHSDSLRTDQVAAHDVKEDDVSSVVSNHKLILLGDQPSHAGGGILLQGVAPRGELKALFDRALSTVAIFIPGSDNFSAVPEKDLAIGIE